MSPKRWLKAIFERTFGGPFEKALDRVRQCPSPRVLVFWNRGLGDIVLGLVPLFDALRAANPATRICVLTRKDLEAGFRLAGVDRIYVSEKLVRGDSNGFSVARTAADAGFREGFDVVLAAPDPTRWLAKRPSERAPRLVVPKEWDHLYKDIPGVLPGRTLIAAHVSAETGQFYGYGKDWPPERWQGLFTRYRHREDIQWLLIGNAPQPEYSYPNVLDLRGKTDLPEIMSLIRHGLRGLIAVDSGILCLTWCLDASYDIDVVSLWADPRQGILKLGLPSPNPLLKHIPLVGTGNSTQSITVRDVETALAGILEPGDRIDHG